ncbi:unnamed protein product [Arctogadus glacialis]
MLMMVFRCKQRRTALMESNSGFRLLNQTCIKDSPGGSQTRAAHCSSPREAGGHRLEVRGRPGNHDTHSGSTVGQVRGNTRGGYAGCNRPSRHRRAQSVPATEVPGTRPPLRHRWLNTGVRQRCRRRGVILLIRAEALQPAPERSAEAVSLRLRRQRGFHSLQPLLTEERDAATRWPPHRTVMLEHLHR